MVSHKTKGNIRAGANIWSHQKTVDERVNLLKKLYPSLDEEVLKKGKLEMTTANMMIENCIGLLTLPLGLGLNFVINGKK